MSDGFSLQHTALGPGLRMRAAWRQPALDSEREVHHHIQRLPKRHLIAATRRAGKAIWQ